ncbi:MAG: PAS domain S-box protein [Pseudomonadota bacterium]
MRIESVTRLFAGTLRRQLVAGMVLVVGGMMSAFVWDLTRRQQDAALAQQTLHADALAEGIATSSAVWVAARDYSGLQEIINGLARYPDLQHAIVLDIHGQVLAHSEASRRGLYLTDLPRQPVRTMLGHDAAMVDIAEPIRLAGKHIGWVRIGLGQESIAAQLAVIERNGIAYALAAVALAALLATLAARRLTRRLDVIRATADAVQAGQRHVRADLAGEDEAAQLAHRFNDMLGTLARQEQETLASRDALAQSESRLSQVMAVTGEGIWDWDLGSGKVGHNPSWCAILGLGREYISHPLDFFISLVHEEDRETVRGRIDACLAGKRRYWSEHRMRHADGHLIWVQDRGDVVARDTNGEPLRMLGSMIDVTERRQLEEELRHAYGENQAVTQAVHDNLYMLDETGRMTWWNRQVEQTTGLAPEVLLGRPGSDFFVPEDRAAVQAAIASVFAEGYGEVEARLITRDGPVWYHYNGVRVFDPKGRVIGVAGVGRDISERIRAFEAVRRSESELKALNESLEARVGERTAELRASRDEAERANAAKSEFLSRMSHELRTPLNAILGFGQLLEHELERSGNAEQVDNTREILHAGEHLLELVNEVLDLSRIESGRLEVSLETVPLAAMVEACLMQIQPLAARRNLSIARRVTTDCGVLADRTRLKEVLLNLLSNAVKYNREGGTIEVACAPGSGQRVRVEVRDTGIGIAAEALPRLFRPFERLEGAYAGVEGTGIGLALAKKLVEAMDGAIGVESVPGEGSTFWFELPVADHAPPEPPAPQHHREMPVAGQERLCTLLYVEDNPANLRLAHKIVAKRAGLRMLDAGNAEDGLAIAVRERPDLILLDINLPDLDGYEALRRLRESPATRDIPVIAVSANAMTRDVRRAMEAGFDDYLTKPLDIGVFLKTIDHFLKDQEEAKA